MGTRISSVLECIVWKSVRIWLGMSGGLAVLHLGRGLINGVWQHFDQVCAYRCWGGSKFTVLYSAMLHNLEQSRLSLFQFFFV